MRRAKQIGHVQLYWRPNFKYNINSDYEHLHNRNFVDRNFHRDRHCSQYTRSMDLQRLVS
jgi:hypothetical protein